MRRHTKANTGEEDANEKGSAAIPGRGLPSRSPDSQTKRRAHHDDRALRPRLQTVAGTVADSPTSWCPKAARKAVRTQWATRPSHVRIQCSRRIGFASLRMGENTRICKFPMRQLLTRHPHHGALLGVRAKKRDQSETGHAPASLGGPRATLVFLSRSPFRSTWADRSSRCSFALRSTHVASAVPAGGMPVSGRATRCAHRTATLPRGLSRGSVRNPAPGLAMVFGRRPAARMPRTRRTNHHRRGF